MDKAVITIMRSGFEKQNYEKIMRINEINKVIGQDNGKLEDLILRENLEKEVVDNMKLWFVEWLSRQDEVEDLEEDELWEMFEEELGWRYDTDYKEFDKLY